MKKEKLEEKILEVLNDESVESPTNFSDLWFELVQLIPGLAPARKPLDYQPVLAAVNSLLREGKVILSLASKEEVEYKISGGTDWCGSNEFAISLSQTDKSRRS